MKFLPKMEGTNDAGLKPVMDNCASLGSGETCISSCAKASLAVSPQFDEVQFPDFWQYVACKLMGIPYGTASQIERKAAKELFYKRAYRG